MIQQRTAEMIACQVRTGGLDQVRVPRRFLEGSRRSVDGPRVERKPAQPPLVVTRPEFWQTKEGVLQDVGLVVIGEM